MAVRYSYDDTTTNKRSIADTLINISFQSAPLLKLFGTGSENLKKFNILNWPTTKVEWLEDTNVLFSTLTTEALDNSETGIDVTVGDGQYFRAGDIIGILPGTQTYGEPAEKFMVSSVSSDTLTVHARGYGDTSATTHSSGATVILISRASGENALYTTEGMTTPTAPYNYTQIIDGFVELSRTEAKMMRYGYHQDHMDYEITKLLDDGGRAGRLAKMLERTFFWGERVQRTGSGDAKGGMGGFKTFHTTSTASSSHITNLSSAALQKDDIHSVMRAIRDSGGDGPLYVITNSWGIEKLCALYEDNRWTTTDNTVVGSPEITKIRTPHGDLSLVYDHLCDKSEIFIVDPKYIGWLPFDEFSRKSVYGDAMNNPYDGVIEGVIGEYTLVVANPKTHGRIYGMSVTA